jgi:hypothetical protein
MTARDVRIIEISESVNEGAFYFICDLDGANYRFDFVYNARDAYWYLSIFDLEGTPVKESIKCVINWPLLMHTMVDVMPNGTLMFLDSRDAVRRSDPAKDELGLTALFAYAIEATE